jgi:hypothetical protein
LSGVHRSLDSRVWTQLEQLLDVRSVDAGARPWLCRYSLIGRSEQVIEQIDARHQMAAFDAGDGRLRHPGPGRELALGQAGCHPRFAQGEGYVHG